MLPVISVVKEQTPVTFRQVVRFWVNTFVE